MGTLFVAGQKLTAASLNQYYGFSEGADTAVTAASQSNLSTPNTIPTNEASVGSAYTIEFGGSGTQGSTQQGSSLTVACRASSSPPTSASPRLRSARTPGSGSAASPGSPAPGSV